MPAPASPSSFLMPPSLDDRSAHVLWVAFANYFERFNCFKTAKASALVLASDPVTAYLEPRSVKTGSICFMRVC